MKEWEDYIKEVEAVGFEKASPIARLIWSCEVGRGVDQHAAPDLEEIADMVQAAQLVLSRYANPNNWKSINGLMVYQTLSHPWEDAAAALKAMKGE